MVSTLAGIALVAVILYKLLLHPLLVSPLSSIPSAQLTAPISSLWLHYIRFVGRENKTIYELHKEKGPILRIAPNELSVNCYEDGIKAIYTGGFEKHEFYLGRFNNYSIPPLVSILHTQPHSTRKRMLSHVYSKSYLFTSPTLKSTVNTVLYDRLLPAIEKLSTTKTPVEMVSFISAYSMDSFTTFQFGLKLGTNFMQEEQKRRWYLERYFLLLAGGWLYWIDNFPHFVSFMHRLGLRLYSTNVDNTAEELQDWNLDLCDQAEALLSKDTDFSVEDIPVVYSELRTAMARSNEVSASTLPQTYPYRFDIATEMFDQNLAAVDTSPKTLTWLLYELSRRPALQSQLREEILTLSPPLSYPKPKISDEEFPHPKAVDSLPLLDAVLNETLRRWAPIGGGQPRLTPEGGCTLAGYPNIPAGVRVQSNAYALHRNEEVFPEPEEWKPERWLTDDPKQLAAMRRWFWPFSSGGRMCIGNHIAINSMKYAIAALYTNYTSEIVSAPDMEQGDGFAAGPKGNELVLQWRHV